MRITNSMMASDYLNSFNNTLNSLNTVQDQLSSGNINTEPSDNPILAYRSLTLNASLTMNQQYTQNASDAVSWMSQSGSALQSLSSIMTQAEQLVVQAGNSTNTSQSYSALGTQMDTLINQAVALGNTQEGDQYVFAGQNTQVSGGPFERTTVNGQDVVVYKGDYNKISMPIQPGAPDPDQDSVNVTGDEVFGPMTTVGGQATAGVFNDLIAIKNQLEATTPDVSYLTTTALTNLQNDANRIELADTQIGAHEASYQMAQTMLGDQNTVINQNLATNDDVDVATATVTYKNLENVYQASLTMGAQVLPMSLANFLSSSS